MKASVIHKFGDVNVLKYEDIETPKPKKGNLLIKILATGINRFDHYIREGSVVQELPFPHILGADAVGVVVELGDEVTNFKLDDTVVPTSGYPTDKKDFAISPLAVAPSFQLSGLHHPGTYAQYMEIPARWTIKDISGLKPEELATLTMPMFTGVRAVKVVGGVKAGDKVLIQAGTSSTGSMQIQIAKALSAQVAATVRSDEKGEIAKSLGADLVINVSKEDQVKKIMEWTNNRGVDVTIDNLGGDVLPKSIDSTKAQGIIVAVGFVAGIEVTFDIRNFFFGQKQLRGTMFGDIADYEWGIEQVRAGKIKPLLDIVLPLSQAAEAHRLISTNQVTGNIVLLPWAT